MNYNIGVESRNKSVSVILPWHRADDYLDQAIDSVKSSTEVKVQLILVDDRVKPIADKRGAESTLRTYGAGYENAINSAKEFIEGDYVALMNSDDLISPLRFHHQIGALRRDEARLCITRLTKMTNKGRIKSPALKRNRGSSISRESLLFSSDLANASWLADSAYWKEKINFENNGNGSDWILATRISDQIATWSYLNDELYFYRQHGKQITSKKHSITMPIVTAWNDLNLKLMLPELDGKIGSQLVFLKANVSTKKLEKHEIDQLLTWSTVLSQRDPNLISELNRRLSIFFVRNFNLGNCQNKQVRNIFSNFLHDSIEVRSKRKARGLCF